MLAVAVGASAQPSRRAPRTAVSVQIGVASGVAAKRRTRSYVLTCGPTGGTLPLAHRVCEDVRLHPRAMLDPPIAAPGQARIVCAGGPWMPLVSVRATRNGVTRAFSGSPGCDWPGNQSLSVYYDAAMRDPGHLPTDELELRCDEAPLLLAVPTPLASVVACRHGLWTPHAERLIRVAAHAPELAALGAPALFPHDVGVLPCVIHAGGAYPGRRLSSSCGVTVRRPWATATVSFTEAWPTTPGNTARHTWHVEVRHGRVLSVTQDGAAPPQTWP